MQSRVNLVILPLVFHRFGLQAQLFGRFERLRGADKAEIVNRSVSPRRKRGQGFPEPQVHTIVVAHTPTMQQCKENACLPDFPWAHTHRLV